MEAYPSDSQKAILNKILVSRDTIDMLRARMFVRPTFGVFVALKLR